MNDGEKMNSKQIGIVILAFASLAFSIAMTVSDYIGFAILCGGPEIPDWISFIFSFLLPIVSAFLFVYFCTIANEKNMVLTGIPMACITLSDLIFSIVAMVGRYIGEETPSTYVQTWDVATISGYILAILFLVFYISTIANKFYEEKMGKTDLIVISFFLFGLEFFGFLESLESDITLINKEYFADSYLHGYFVTCAYGDTFEFIFHMLMYIAMLLLVKNKPAKKYTSAATVE